MAIRSASVIDRAEVTTRSPGPERKTSLLGRESECRLLGGLVGDVRLGRSRSLVLRGEAGIGKTALLVYLVESASDMTVVRAAGVESEMELPYASLHQLCASLLDRLERLPAPQRQALEIVFGLSAGPAPDRFLVGLGVLTLLSEVAEERPLLCVVDDAQWLDKASALTLAFAARRLRANPVGMVFAARERGEELAHLPELEVCGLIKDDACALLSSLACFRLDQVVRDRIIAETHGNPLALLELPRGLTMTELAGGFGILGAQDLPGRIEEGFVRRLETLDDDARRLLLIAAAEPLGDRVLLERAAERLGIGPEAAEGAEAHGLLATGECVTFRHPLVRSAVYRSAEVDDRRAVHSALADVTDRDADPDRRAWHLAMAAAWPDERAASELERSAGRAQARGGLAAAAAFLQRAVALTHDPTRRAGRALAAAQASLGAGAIDVARGLVAAADAGPLDELQRARLDLLRAQARYSESRGSEAPALLLRAAKTLDPLDPKLARETYLDAWSAALFAGRLASTCGLRDVSRDALAAPRPAGPTRPSDLLLEGFARAFTDGRSTAAPVLERAARAFAGTDVSTEEVFRWGWLATAAAVMVWDYETCLAVATRGVQLAREAGALTVLPVSVNVMTQALVLGGEFGQAALLVAEADSVTEATGTQVAPYGALVLAGLQGREASATKLIDGSIQAFAAGGQGTAVQYAHWARSLLLNGLGRHAEALDAAAQATEDTPELFVTVWAAIELLEAAIRSDKPEAANRALERIVAATAVAPTEWALGILARSRALVRGGGAADELYREAIDRLSRTRLRPELARAHLLYGEWLRRRRRRVDAREQLRAAYDRFSSIGMEAFAERARRELLATGEHVRKRTVETRDHLTAQERQIAGLAGDGLSNQEIAARLFLSQHTVGYHLRKVFSKLEITSRNQLTEVLPDDADAAPVA
jgi:DNA-binding CsgD family transcriptional regulator/tetratricopeptide (TPR) repeat protein